MVPSSKGGLIKPFGGGDKSYNTSKGTEKDLHQETKTKRTGFEYSQICFYITFIIRRAFPSDIKLEYCSYINMAYQTNDKANAFTLTDHFL